MKFYKPPGDLKLSRKKTATNYELWIGLILLMIAMMSNSKINAQTLEWSSIHDYTGSLGGHLKMIKDASGNHFMTGSFLQNIDLDPGTGTDIVTIPGSQADFYIVQLDANGDYVWGETYGSSSYYDNIYGFDMDASGNMYLTGTFYGTVDYDLSTNDASITSVGGADVFVMKLNKSGEFQWVYTAGGTSDEQPTDITVDDAGDVYITGSIGAAGGDFDPDSKVTLTLGGSGGEDIFVVKIDGTDGSLIWGSGYGGTGNDRGSVIDWDETEGIIVGGYFESTVGFHPEISKTAAGGKDAFILKLDESGTYQGVYNFGGSGDDEVNDLAFAKTSILAAGRFDATVDFDASGGISNQTIGDADKDYYLLNLSKSLTYNWVETITKTSAGGIKFDIDSFGSMYVAITHQTIRGSVYIYDSSRNLEFSMEDRNYYQPGDIVVDGADFYTLGGHTSTMYLELCSTTTYSAASNSRFPFLLKYNTEQYADTPTISATSQLICGSGSSTLSITSGDLNDAGIWRWRSGSCNGAIVGSGTSISVSPTVTTTYYVRGEGYSCYANPSVCASITIIVGESPTDISLTSEAIDENLSIGSTIGTLSSVDATSGDSHSYTLISGTGDTDNASFAISGSNLNSAEVFDYETKNSYSIRIQSEDATGCTHEEAFTITVNNEAPESPSDITLSNSSINENNVVNDVIGTFSATDDDSGETYTYSLVSGAGDTDNGSFNIDGSDLRASESFNFETKTSYAIRVQTNDGNSGTFEKELTISVTNVIELENDILTFSIPEQTTAAEIDATNHTINVTVPYNTDRSSMTPTLTIDNSATVSPLSGVAQNFNSSVVYTVTAEDGTQQNWTVTVIAPIPGGTYAIGAGQEFTSLTNLINYLNTNGISGDVVFELSTNQSSGSVYEIEDYPGTDQYSFTLRPASGASNIVINPAIRLEGVENFTILGMNEISFTYGVTIQNGVNDALKSSKNVTISGTSMTGVSLRGVDGVDINGNTMRGVGISGAATIYRGSLIYVDNITEVRDVTIQNNDMVYGQEFNPASTYSSVYGLRQLSQVAGYLKIYNNTIRLNPAQTYQGEITGLIASADDVEIYHNTILLEGGEGNTVTANCIKVTATNSAIIKNNILDTNVPQAGTTDNISQVGIWLTDSSIPTVEIEENNITYLNADRRYDGYIRQNSFDYALDEDDLTTIEASFPGTTYSDVTFVDQSNNDFTLDGISLSDADLRGTPIAGITTDIEGTTRSSNSPSKGALESPNTIAEITAFTFTNQYGDAVIDSDAHTVTAELSAAGDLTNISPLVSVFAGASVSPLSGQSQNFSTSVIYTVIAEAGNSQEWSVTITELNEEPDEIMISSTSIDENAGDNAAVGTLSTDDPNTSDTHTYSLVSGLGDNSNTLFEIDGDVLRAKSSFDHESISNPIYIRIRSTDQGGLFTEITWEITVNDINEAPTDISLNNLSIEENNSVDDLIGAFTASDVDAGSSFTYSLKDNASYPDNLAFSISSDELLAAQMFDYEVKSSYTILVEVSDGALVYSEEFTITVSDDANEPLIWTGTAWMNGTPGAGSDDVVIAGDYNTADDGAIDVKSITINSGITYTVAPGDQLYVVDDITNNGSLIIESGADLMTFQSGTFTGNDVVIKRNTRYADGKYSFVGTPVQQTANVTNATLGSHVYSYDESQSYDPNEGANRWIAMSGELVPGVGYTQAMQQEIIFTGLPNVGTVDVSGTYTGTYDDGISEENEGWVFVSNPYATAIDVADFLGANANIEGAVYIWDDNGSDNGRGSNSDYIIANGSVATNNTPAGGETRYNQRLGSAQGFFVKLTDHADTEVSFAPDMRVTGGNSDDNFFRKAGTPAYVRVNLTNEGGLFKQAIVGRIAGISDESIDRSFDAKVFSSKGSDLIYTVKDQKALAIQGISHEREVVQLAYNVSEAGIYTIYLDIKNGQGERFYLLDKLTDKTIDLSTESYSFSSSAGQFADRFELLSNARILGLDVSKIQVYAHDQTIYINMPSGMERTIDLINLNGQKVLTRTISQSMQIQTNLPAGIYLISDGERTHKVILK